ncbi:MAG: transketolase family protein [Sciscionella sp.]
MDMREVFLATVADALDDDPRLAVVLADISAAQLADAAGRHPDRVVNLGIREQLLVSVGGGLALTGMRPVLHSFGPFLVERPFEQVKLDLGHQNVGAVLVSYGGSYDMPGAGRTHQSPGDVALLDTLPGWTIHVPGHPDEARSLLLDALPGDNPVYLRLSGQTNTEAFPTGEVHVPRRGSSGVVLAVGPVLDAVLAATEHADVTVLYTATARPFPARALHAAVRQTGRADVLVVEPYHVGTSAHAVSEALADIPHRLRSVGVRRQSELRVYGSPADHDAAHGLDAAGIAVALHRLTHPQPD